MIGNRRFVAGALLLACSALFSPAAPAQSAKTAAESLFQAAKQLMGDKKFAEACPKLVESQKLDPSPGTQLNLAKCYEGLGKIASAWAEYKSAAVLAHQLGQKDREDGARELAKGLEPKLSKLTVQAAQTPGLAVKSDGVEIGAASFGTALFVDPGEHLIEATAIGYETWTTKVTVGPNGDSKSANVPPLVKKPEAPPVPSVTASATATVGPQASGAATAPPAASGAATSAPQGSPGMRTGSYVLMGVGLAGVAVGAVMGGLAASDVGSARSNPTLCPQNLCSPKGRALVNDAGTKALVSTIALPVGAVAAGAGLVLFLLSGPSSPKKADSAKGPSFVAAPAIGTDGGGLFVTGRF